MKIIIINISSIWISFDNTQLSVVLFDYPTSKIYAKNFISLSRNKNFTVWGAYILYPKNYVNFIFRCDKSIIKPTPNDAF